jgi:hypothetical protein
MPNAIKYNVSAETLALKKGNFWIGTGDVGKGPTSSTGFYNGLTPPSGGYTIYINKATGGPSIYTVNTEAQMVSLTNSIGSQSFTTSGQCLNWFATQTDKMIFNRDYPGIVTDGLFLHFDGGFTPSYPTTNTNWYNVSPSGNNGTLINGPTYSSNNGGVIVFDGVDDYGTVETTGAWGNNPFSITVACYPGFDQAQYGRPMFTKWNNCGEGEFAFEYGRDNNSSGLPNKFSGLIGRSLIFESTNQYPKNNWYIVTFTYNTTGNYKFYLNGVLETLGSTGQVPGLNGNYGIGRYDGCYPAVGGWMGNLGVISLYNKVLSNNEVLQNYNVLKGRYGLS